MSWLSEQDEMQTAREVSRQEEHAGFPGKKTFTFKWQHSPIIMLLATIQVQSPTNSTQQQYAPIITILATIHVPSGDLNRSCSRRLGKDG